MQYFKTLHVLSLIMPFVAISPIGYGGTPDSLKRHVYDDFGAISESAYRTHGQVKWHPGYVELGDKGRLAFPRIIGKQVYGPKWKVHLTVAGELQDSVATLSVRFHLGRDAARVQFHATVKDGRLFETVRIMEETEHALPYSVRELTLAVAGKRSPFRNAWVIDYNHGLVTLRRDGKPVLVGSVHLPDGVEPATTPLFQIETVQSAGRWRCDQLSFESTAPQFTPADKRDDVLLANRLERQAAGFALKRQWYQALPAAQDVLRLREKALGRKHYSVAKAMHELGVVQHNLGRYEDAKKMLTDAATLWREVTGADHPASIHTLIVLGETSNQLGDAHAHLTALESAYRLSQAVYGGIHPVTADVLFRMAEWYSQRNDVTRAKQLHKEAYAIRERMFMLRATGSWPKTDRRKSLIDSLAALASLDLRANDAAAAETKYFQITAMRKQMFGPNAPIVAHSKRPLALMAKQRGLWLLAEQYERSVLLVHQQEFGREHPETAASMIHVAETLLRKPNPTPSEITEASALLRSGLRMQQAWLLKTGAAPPTPSRSACIVAHRQGLNAAVALSASGKCPAALAYRYVFLGKHMPRLVDEWLTAVGKAPSAKKDVDQMSRASHLLSLMAYEPFQPMVVEDFPVLAAEIELLQQRLTRKTPMPWGRSAIDLKSLQKSLPQNTALLDFATYTQHGSAGQINKTETRLAAFLVTSRRVDCIDFGPTQSIEALLENPDELRASLWPQISKHLGSTKLLFVAPNEMTSSLPPSVFSDGKVTAAMLPKSKVAMQLMKATQHPYPSEWSSWMTAGFRTGVAVAPARADVSATTPALRAKGFPIIPSSVALIAAGIIAIGVGAIKRRRRQIS